MEALSFTQHRLSREDMLTGMGASILVHVLVFAAALITPWMMPGSSSQTPFLSVNLVSMQEMGGAGAPAQKGPGEKSSGVAKSRETQRIQASASSKSGPVVPVKRLRLDDPAVKTDTELKKLNPHDIPKVSENTHSSVSVEKSLEKLISKPKTQPRPAAGAQSAADETEKRPAAQESGAKGGQSQAAEKAGEKGQGGGAQGKNPKGGAEGSPSGSIDGSGRVASALFGMYGDRVREAISRQWAWPEAVKSQGLETRLVVVVSRDGKVLNVSIEKASGNALFDDAAIRAVRKASPLPSLPEVINYPKVEIDLRFRPEGLS